MLSSSAGGRFCYLCVEEKCAFHKKKTLNKRAELQYSLNAAIRTSLALKHLSERNVSSFNLNCKRNQYDGVTKQKSTECNENI